MNNLNPTIAQALMPAIPAALRKPRERRVTVTYEGAEFEVAYDYQPAERAVLDLESPLCGPGCDAEVEIYAIYHKGDEITDVVRDDIREWMEQDVLRQLGED